MTEPRSNTKCRRCGFRYGAHSASADDCPDGSGRTFQRHAQSGRVGTSFTRGEVELLARVLRNALRAGGSSRELVALRRKFDAMELRAQRAGEPEAKAS